MKDLAICNVVVGSDNRYFHQQERLKHSLATHVPEATLFFWEHAYPPGSKTHGDSLYGFKVHAVMAALALGYKKIMWLDTGMICQGPVDYYFEGGNVPVLAVRDDSKLEDTISDKAMKYYGNVDIIGLNLVGGSLYCFDFESQVCIDVFELWAQAERDGIFGTLEESVTEKINKHRHDESCMAMSLFLNGRQPVSPDKAKYCQGPESIFIKKHFK